MGSEAYLRPGVSLVQNGVVDHALCRAVIKWCAARPTTLLLHVDHEEIINRVDHKQRAADTAPAKVATTRRVGWVGRLQMKAQAPAAAVAIKEMLPRYIWRQLLLRHQAERGWFQNTLVAIGAFVQQHLRETHIVLSG